MESKPKEQNAPADRKLNEELNRDRMVELLNQDLAREYQAIIAYVVYSQTMKGAEYIAIANELKKHAGEELDHALKIARQIDHLGGTPTVVPRPVEMSADAKKMLRFDLHNERETIANYRERIRQADEMGEFALGEVLRTIIAQEQEHEADLCDALGIEVPSLPEPAAR
jgi:bacterioferritin